MTIPRGKHRRPSAASKVMPKVMPTAYGAIAAGAVVSTATLPQHTIPAVVTHAHPATTAKNLLASAQVARTTARPATFTVVAGDTLSAIAGKDCGNPADWTGIAAVNKIANPDLILPGQRFTLDCAQAVLATAAHTSAPATDHDGDHDGDWSDAPPVVTQATGHISGGSGRQAVTPAANSTYTGGTGFQACVIARESGGNSQVMNSTGHYGLYQFSASTWAINGGNPATFGNASVAEQNQVFATAMSKPGGAQNWAPYDGC